MFLSHFQCCGSFNSLSYLLWILHLQCNKKMLKGIFLQSWTIFYIWISNHYCFNTAIHDNDWKQTALVSVPLLKTDCQNTERLPCHGLHKKRFDISFCFMTQVSWISSWGRSLPSSPQREALNINYNMEKHQNLAKGLLTTVPAYIYSWIPTKLLWHLNGPICKAGDGSG